LKGRHYEALPKEGEMSNQAEKILRRLIEFDGILTRVLSGFATCTLRDMDAHIVDGLGSIARFIGAPHAFVLMIAPDRSSWSCTHEWCGPHIPSLKSKYQKVPMGTAPWSEKIIISGEVVRVSSLDDFPPEALGERMFHEEDGACAFLELPIRSTTGQVAGCVGLRVYSYPIVWSEDDILRLRLIGDTISGLLERKRAETALKEHEERLRLSLEGSDVGAWDWNIAEDRVVYFRHWAEMLGYASGEIDNSVRAWESLVHPDDLERVKSAIKDHVSGESPLYAVEHRVLSKSGEWRWLLFRGRVVERSEAGKPLRAVGIHVDVTKRKASEDQLRQSEEKLRTAEAQYRGIFENALEGIYQTSLEGKSLVANQALALMLGYSSPEELISMVTDTAHQVWVNPDERAGYMRRLMDDQVIHGFECQFLRKDKTRIWVSLSSRLIRDPDGCPLHIEGFVEDITRRKQSELTLLESRAQVLSIFNSTEDFIFSVDPTEYGLLTWNESIRRYFSEERGIELRVGMTPAQLLPPDSASIWREFYLHALKEGAFTSEYEVAAGTRTLLLSFSLLKRGEEVFGISVFGKDITRRKQIEEELEKRLLENNELRVRLEAESAYLQQEIKLEHNFENIIGQSNVLKYVLYRVQQVAPTDMSVLILGETGTGKELIARAIHESSSRRARPLIKVNCAALQANLIESELFGHEKGAFTGAAVRKPGRFELANHATLFLDEIGEIPLDLQAKLLRALEDGEFERLGGTQTIRVDVRIIAATNRDLEREMKEGRFRADLWYRLNVYPITVPALRERIEDIPLMVAHFVESYSKQFGRTIQKIPTRVIEKLKGYHWPGNIRELKHVVERAVIGSSRPTLELADSLSFSAAPGASGLDASMTLEEMERQYILKVLEKTGWKIEGKSGAAETLDIKPNTLRSRMQKLGIRKNLSYYSSR
jgi:PAS domain S-box-containing protein